MYVYLFEYLLSFVRELLTCSLNGNMTNEIEYERMIACSFMLLLAGSSILLRKWLHDLCFGLLDNSFATMFKIVFAGLATVFIFQMLSHTKVQPRYRFDSFAPARNASKIKWFVDGQDYMSAVADAIEAATKEILITDWQMNPYIFMKRSDNGVDSLEWRLDQMLKRKADQGVLVYILLYWETNPPLDLGSNHTQSFLNKHSNIVVYRHPDQLSVIKNPGAMRWSHHEKLVIVDRSIAFVGGIDLCFGRWDTHDHSLMDNYLVHECAKRDCGNKNSKVDKKYFRWIGKDYVNTFFSNDKAVDWEMPDDDYEYVNRNQIPRMPWHDVACAFVGAAVSDTVKHFIQRYNALNPTWWKRWELRDLPSELDVSRYIVPGISSYTLANVQVLRSVDNWSAGQPHEDSIYKAYLDVIKNAKHYIYIENQFFISSQPGLVMNVKNQIQSALADRIYRAYTENEEFHVMIVMPLKPEFGPEEWTSGTLNRLTGISYWNYATLYSGKSSLFNKLKEKKIPVFFMSSYFSVYGLRTHGSLGKSLATEIIYVHSKLMIVDDRVAIIGSANINDRSMLGERDSEVAVIVEDVEMIDSKMNGKPWQVGKFSHTLRCHLHREHLGLLNMETQVAKLNVKDPLLDLFITGIFNQANDNTLIYERVFRSRVLPTNQVWNYNDLENWKKQQGLVDIDQKLAEGELEKIRGNIVTFPADFLKDELKPSAIDFLNLFHP